MEITRKRLFAQGSTSDPNSEQANVEVGEPLKATLLQRPASVLDRNGQWALLPRRQKDGSFFLQLMYGEIKPRLVITEAVINYTKARLLRVTVDATDGYQEAEKCQWRLVPAQAN